MVSIFRTFSEVSSEMGSYGLRKTMVKKDLRLIHERLKMGSYTAEVRACHWHQNVKGGAEKLREKKKRFLEEGASKYLKISDLFGKPPTGDSDTKVSCCVDLANVSLLFTDEVTFPTS